MAIAERVAPDRVVSVVDSESRHVHKTVHDYRDGYKAHAAAEPETGIITDVAITPGNTPDAETARDLLADETAPVDVLGDSVFGSGKLRAKLNALGHGATIKPIPLRSAVPGGFTTDDFTLDTENSTVTCPASQTVALTASSTRPSGSCAPAARFAPSARPPRPGVRSTCIARTLSSGPLAPPLAERSRRSIRRDRRARARERP